MENFHKKSTKITRISYIFSKILIFCSTGINIYLINNKTYNFLEKYTYDKKSKKELVFRHFRSDLEQDPDPDPLFHEVDPRIKIIRIRNTAFLYSLRWRDV